MEGLVELPLGVFAYIVQLLDTRSFLRLSQTSRAMSTRLDTALVRLLLPHWQQQHPGRPVYGRHATWRRRRDQWATRSLTRSWRRVGVKCVYCDHRVSTYSWPKDNDVNPVRLLRRVNSSTSSSTSSSSSSSCELVFACPKCTRCSLLYLGEPCCDQMSAAMCSTCRTPLCRVHHVPSPSSLLSFNNERCVLEPRCSACSRTTRELTQQGHFNSYMSGCQQMDHPQQLQRVFCSLCLPAAGSAAAAAAAAAAGLSSAGHHCGDCGYICAVCFAREGYQMCEICVWPATTDQHASCCQELKMAPCPQSGCAGICLRSDIDVHHLCSQCDRYFHFPEGDPNHFEQMHIECNECGLLVCPLCVSPTRRKCAFCELDICSDCLANCVVCQQPHCPMCRTMITEPGYHQDRPYCLDCRP